MAPITSLPITSLNASALVALGGAFGALARYHLGRAVAQWLGAQAVGGFPWPTFAANILGSLAMGALMGWLARHGHANEPARLLLGVGLLGGFTTFSAFSLELFALIERGQWPLALGYALASLIAGVGALALGFAILRLGA